jgi:restriction system protein
MWADAPLVMVAVPAATMTVLAYDGRMGSGRVHELALWVTAALGAIILLGVVGVAPRFMSDEYQRSGIQTVDEMDGVEFEHRLQSLYEYLGYTVETTSVSGDYGADLVLVKDGERSVVQAKRYSGNVGLEAVQQAVTALAHYNATFAIVASNSYYTKAAQQLAASNNVTLIDRGALTAMLAAQSDDVPERVGLNLLLAQVACGVGPLLRAVWRLVYLGVRILWGTVRVGLALWR